MIHTVRVFAKSTEDPRGSELLSEIKHLHLGTFSSIKTAKVYRVEGVTKRQTKRLARRIVDVDQDYSLDAQSLVGGLIVEVAYKPGVMNPEAASLMKMAHDLGLEGVLAADSSVEYHFCGGSQTAMGAVVDRLLVNKTVQHVVTHQPATLLLTAGSEAAVKVALPHAQSWEDFLRQTPHDCFSSLNQEECKAVWEHVRKRGRDLTDAEGYLIGVRWSEHCGHKTFKSRLQTPSGEKEPLIKRLMATSALYSRNVLSSFVDNSGVAVFYDGYAVNGKVETHNSPSALEPYGGAATGTGGVLRDILGTGKGARPIASTDMFCVAEPSFPAAELPKGCLPPHYLFRHVVRGVKDYGNRMGVPTINGSVHFHPDFCAKPVVLVGAYGIMPAKAAAKGKPRKGDLVVAIGGRTGRDGIHGATFSSQEMTDRTVLVNATAVQIGNAIEEKRTLDALLALRDGKLIVAQTDCGAGGFGCAISELGAGGVSVELDKAPLKYPGLQPWEILLSESQERMVIAVRADDASKVLEVCRGFNVEATVLGRFTGNKRFVATYHGEAVCDLSSDFLDDGLPQRVMRARWEPPSFPVPDNALLQSVPLRERILKVLAHGNVASKEPIVRRYDHSVQGMSALPPFSGVNHDGPNDAAILRPLHGKPYGLVLSHGLEAVLNRIDPYWGSINAGVKALANLVAVGGNPAEGESWLIDNFVWPFPDEEGLGGLDRAVDACCDLMHAFRLPFISGKDSLSGTYRGGNRVIKIPPVLCVSAFGRIPDVAATMSADFKSIGSKIYLVGKQDWGALGGSVYYDTFGYVGNVVPEPDLKALPIVFRAVHRWIAEGSVRAVHDVSSGGLVAAVAEMCFGGDLGASIYLDALDGEHELFNQTPGCFIVEVPAGGKDIEQELPDFVWEIGFTSKWRTLRIEERKSSDGPAVVDIPLDTLKRVWKAPMQEMFGHD